ncbi:hypothetical protein B0J17DRAFT_674311, partial [Rhizoctonia solani]
MRETLVLIKAITREPPKRPMDVVPDNEAGNALWDLMCACWSYDPTKRPSSADISEIMNALDLSQPFTEVHQGLGSSMGFTPEIGIEEMVTFFTQNGLIDYTDELKRGDTKFKLHIPYLATAAALLYKIDLPINKVIIKCAVNESPYKQLKSGYQHENILPLLGFAVLDGNLAMISPWVENGSVTGYVKKQQKPDYYGLCIQLSCAVAYLHEHGVIHGDIKGVGHNGLPLLPVFSLPYLAGQRPYFGQGYCESDRFRRIDQGAPTARVHIHGKGQRHGVMAPEILRRKTDSTTEGDVYAMGM